MPTNSIRAALFQSIRSDRPRGHRSRPGDPAAMLNPGDFYAMDRCDRELAQFWLRRPAVRGHHPAMTYLRGGFHSLRSAAPRVGRLHDFADLGREDVVLCEALIHPVVGMTAALDSAWRSFAASSKHTPEASR